MSLISGFILLLSTSFAVLQEFPTDCCPWKWVPDNGIFTYYNVTPELHERYGCLDDCLYVKKGTEDKYCFAPGPLKVVCEGKPSASDNISTYYPTLVPNLLNLICLAYEFCFHLLILSVAITYIKLI